MMMDLNINTKNMPIELTVGLLNNFRIDFEQLLRHLSLSTRYSYLINIEFSLEEKYKSYGCYSIDEIRNIIKTKWETNREVLEILSRIRDYSDYLEYAEVFAARIARLNHSNYDPVRSYNDNLFGWLKVKMKTVAEYIDDTKTIIFYVQSIRDTCPNSVQFIAHFNSIFVHEAFHAYHYEAGNIYSYEVKNRLDYTADVIKESLATYVENIFLSSKGYSERDYNYSVLTVPYAGFKFVNSSNFVDIFAESLKNMDDALRKLLDYNTFCSIKNKEEFREIYLNNSSNGAISTINCYYINQKYDAINEYLHHHLHCDKTTKNAEIFKELNVGDVIISNIGGYNIKAIGVVTSDYYEIGNDAFVDVYYVFLDNMVLLDEVFRNTIGFRASMSYISKIDNAVCKDILELIFANNPNNMFVEKTKNRL